MHSDVIFGEHLGSSIDVGVNLDGVGIGGIDGGVGIGSFDEVVGIDGAASLGSVNEIIGAVVIGRNDVGNGIGIRGSGLNVCNGG